LLENKVRLAESQREAAADELKESTDQALREVALAYDQVETGLQRYDAAIALQTAAAAAFRSASDSYAQGVGTFTDAVSARLDLPHREPRWSGPRAVTPRRLLLRPGS